MAATNTGCLRLVVDIHTVLADPVTADAEYNFLCSLLPEHSQEKVGRFVQFADRKRALVSRLLQRHCASSVLGASFLDVPIERTKGGKPYVPNTVPRPGHCPNFNYNVSHEGQYVALASEPLCVVGMDVAAPQQLRSRAKPMSPADVQRLFHSTCCQAEWAFINAELAHRGPAHFERAFRLHWSLKESFVKARGDGLGFDLQRAGFSLADPEKEGGGVAASVLVDDARPQPDWRFWAQPLNDHWLTVARGPPSAVVDAYGGFSATLQHPDVAADAQTWQAALDADAPPFQVVTVDDLLPEPQRAALDRLRSSSTSP
eukprot:m.152168 g.152168  ORF g.152168 m.152168 type:complete len:316 (-) comp17434_c0_seq2:2150-3097(-)